MNGIAVRCHALIVNEFYSFVRFNSTKVRIVADLPTSLHSDIESNSLKPRRHPGIVKSPLKSLPDEIQKSIVEVIGDSSLKKLQKDGKHFSSYLLMRHIPAEEDDIKEKRNSILKEVQSSLDFNIEKASEEEIKHYNQVVNSKVTNIMKKRIYNWTSIDYTHHMGLLYLVSRATSEYTVLSRVFQELKRAVPEFQPKSLFDFGSGVGTVIWAAESMWKNSIEEYFCVDTSSHMNDLSSQIIEKSGYNISDRIFHRQFLPASYDRKYDIVISAYSLLELPSMSARLQTLYNLWNKTSKYLILVERGTNAYFKLITEARDYILMNSKDEEENVHHAYVVAPCPHEFSCPRIEADNTPCNFNVQFKEHYQKAEDCEELFTYIIISKGKRNVNDEQWPRIVRPVLLRSRHAVCKLCTNSGRLEQITFSPTKPNKSTYRCAKSSKWGDLLPVDIKYITETENT